MTRRKARKAFVQACAEQLWRVYGLSHPDKFCLEDVAMARGVYVRDGKLSSAEARLIRLGKKGIVRVSEGLHPPTRRRFAIAHELGHWEIHPEVSQVFLCTADDMIASYKRSPVEAEASYFASALLMPSKLFREEVRGERPTFDEIERLGIIFGASLTATAIRWMDLATDYCAVVACEGGKIKWWRGSERFEASLWINVGQQISKYSVASRMNNGETNLSEDTVSIDTWADEREQLISDDLVEQAIHLKKYGRTLSLLWLS